MVAAIVKRVMSLILLGMIPLGACACGRGAPTVEVRPTQLPLPLDETTLLGSSPNSFTPEPMPVEVTRIPPGSFDNLNMTPFPTFPRIEMAVEEVRPDFVQAVAPREYRKIPLDIYNAVPFGAVSGAFGIDPFDLVTPTSDLPSYRSSICVRPRAALLVEEGDVFAPDYEDIVRFMDRMELLIDGEPMKITGNLGGRFFWLRETETLFMENTDYCWYAPLGVEPAERRSATRPRKGM